MQSFHRHLRTLPRAAALAAAAFGSVAVVKAQESAPKAGSPIEKPTRNLERQEQDVTVGAAMGRLKALQQELDDLKGRAAELASNLAKSNAEAAEYKDSYGRMRLQMEALGVAALGGDERSLQLRLLNAVNDYRLAEKEKQALAEHLVKMAEAALTFLKSGDQESRQRLEAALTESNALLHQTGEKEKAQAVPVDAARVVSFKKDLGLAVINAGKDSGLRLGLPLKFVRADRSIATGVVVDCRERITGVLITTTAAEDAAVAVGDSIMLEPTKTDAKE